MTTYQANLIIGITDLESLHQFGASLSVDFDQPTDPLASLTVAALEKALEQAKLAVRMSGGRT